MVHTEIKAEGASLYSYLHFFINVFILLGRDSKGRGEKDDGFVRVTFKTEKGEDAF